MQSAYREFEKVKCVNYQFSTIFPLPVVLGGLRKGIIRFLIFLYSLKVSLQFFAIIQMAAGNSKNVTNKYTPNSSHTPQSTSTEHQPWPQQVLVALKIRIYPAKKEPLGGAARLGTGPSWQSLAGIELVLQGLNPCPGSQAEGSLLTHGTGNSGLPSSGCKQSPFYLHVAP